MTAAGGIYDKYDTTVSNEILSELISQIIIQK
jgi:hypothetical protein